MSRKLKVEIFGYNRGGPIVMTATNSATAAFVLREAEAAGFAFASNGIEMVTRAPPGISRESLHTFERAIFDHRIEIMALIVDTYPACR
jgi:hypothetical protein